MGWEDKWDHDTNWPLVQGGLYLAEEATKSVIGRFGIPRDPDVVYEIAFEVAIRFVRNTKRKPCGNDRQSLRNYACNISREWLRDRDATESLASRIMPLLERRAKPDDPVLESGFFDIFLECINRESAKRERDIFDIVLSLTEFVMPKRIASELPYKSNSAATGNSNLRATIDRVWRRLRTSVSQLILFKPTHSMAQLLFALSRSPLEEARSHFTCAYAYYHSAKIHLSNGQNFLTQEELQTAISSHTAVIRQSVLVGDEFLDGRLLFLDQCHVYFGEVLRHGNVQDEDCPGCTPDLAIAAWQDEYTEEEQMADEQNGIAFGEHWPSIIVSAGRLKEAAGLPD